MESLRGRSRAVATFPSIIYRCSVRFVEAMARRRRSAKRIGLAAVLFVTGAWITTLFYGVVWTNANTHVSGGVMGGKVFLQEVYFPKPRANGAPGWRVARVAGPGTPEFNFHYGSGGRWFAFPLWFVALVLAVPTAVMWWKDSRRVRGVCAKCGYSLAGLARDAPCPECGTPGTSGSVDSRGSVTDAP